MSHWQVMETRVFSAEFFTGKVRNIHKTLTVIYSLSAAAPLQLSDDSLTGF